MSTNPSGPCRVVVAGTTFGQVYLEGLGGAAVATDAGLRPSIELAGILAHGSRRSTQCAAHYRVPLYHSVEELPPEVDMACVVVRSGLLGGGGDALAARLLERGVDVLQEHPLHTRELSALVGAARAAGGRFELNTFYPYLPRVARFVELAEVVRAEVGVERIEATCGYQVAYACLDLLAQVVGRTRPCELSLSDRSAGWVDLTGRIGGVPVRLRLAHQLSPSQPDASRQLISRVSVITSVGELSLGGVNGPIVWTGRPAIPTHLHTQDAPFFASPPTGGPPAARVVVDAGRGGYPAMLASDFPRAARAAVQGFAARAAQPADSASRIERWLALCVLWQQVAGVIGTPDPLDEAGVMSDRLQEMIDGSGLR